jgi:tetratricopeptide (TPR) repeat protein
MGLGTDTYMLLHRILEAAETRADLEIARKSFQAIVDEKRGCTSREDRFDVAWSMSCLAGIYVRLEQPRLAEQFYLAAIRLFYENDMAAHSACLSVALATMYVELERAQDAEEQLKENVRYQAKEWDEGSRQSKAAEEELLHFQKTGEIIQAFEHRYCEPCGVDDYGIGFEELPNNIE